jgi:flagellar L-ring protein precursor FlgH
VSATTKLSLRHRAPACTALLALACAVAALPAAARAVQPLIDLGTGRGLFHDVKAVEVGDIVTIVIEESATADTRATTDTNNKTEVSGGPGLGLLDLVPKWGLDSENKYKADGKSTRGGSLSARISARVVEALSNGLLRIEGTRLVEVNNEKQLISLTGLIRTRDLRADNTIASTYVADAQIHYSGRGPITNAHEPGLFTRIVNWVF